jgi:TRAP transporter TAXI family solute receptor
MKKIFLISLLSLMVIGLILAGCTGPAPTTTTPPTTPAPSSTAGEHEQIHININSMAFGGSGYIACFTLGEVINKYSPWLRSTVYETPGGVYGVKQLTNDPSSRENTIIYLTFASTTLAKQGLPPFETPYDGVRAISMAQRVAHSWVTLDPDIKGGRDFAGKRIGMPGAGSSANIEPEMIMEYGWGVKDKAKLEYLGWSESIQALRDGMVDVAIANPIYVGDDKVSPNPALDELVSLRSDYHFVPIPKEDIATAREKSGYPLYSAELPPGAIAAAQTEPLPVGLLMNGWACAKELPDDIVYEIDSLIYEHYEDFWPKHASLKGLKPELMANLTDTESDYHPGAVKFFNDHGLEIGSMFK